MKFDPSNVVAGTRLTPKLRQNVLETATMLPVFFDLVSLRLDAKEVLEFVGLYIT